MSPACGLLHPLQVQIVEIEAEVDVRGNAFHLNPDNHGNLRIIRVKHKNTSLGSYRWPDRSSAHSKESTCG